MTASLACLNSASSALSLTSGKADGDGRLEEVPVAVDLLDGDLGGDPRRIVEVLARLGQRRGHGLFARDEQPQPLVGRRVGPLDHQVGGVGDAAAVAVRIPGPGPDDLERQDPRVDGPQQLLAIELVRRRERRRVDRGSRSRNSRAAATSSVTAWRDGSRACRRTCECRDTSPASAAGDTCPRDNRARPR